MKKSKKLYQCGCGVSSCMNEEDYKKHKEICGKIGKDRFDAKIRNKKGFIQNPILIAIVVSIFALTIISSYFYYKDKEQKSTNIPNNTEKETIGNATSRDSYETMKSQLLHHFAACFSTKKLSCANGICEKLEPITFWLLAGTISSGTLSRCDSKGCDSYDAIAYQSGIFENIQPKEPRGFLFKRQLLDMSGNAANPSEFVDVASIGLSTVISTGYCVDVL